MKRIAVIIAIVASVTYSFAQTKESKDSVLNRIDSLVQITNMWLEQIELNNSLKHRYKLYQTENIYTLLQLDTKTGMIEQVQWSLDSNNEGICNNKWRRFEHGIWFWLWEFRVISHKEYVSVYFT